MQAMCQRFLQLHGLCKLLHLDLMAQFGEKKTCGIHADICRNQDGFQLLVQIIVNFSTTYEEVGQLAASTCQPFLKSAQPADFFWGLLLGGIFFQKAKHGYRCQESSKKGAKCRIIRTYRGGACRPAIIS